MAETDIKTFNCDAFSKDLTQQAAEVVPKDISPEDKKFVLDIIFRFCKMAGDALVAEENSILTASEVSLVTQFIGEWIFHKSIDLIRGGVDSKFREGILQKVAFTVFDIAKKAIEKKLPQEQLITLVEAHVKKCFTKAIEDLTKKGAVSEDVSKNALSQSNIDVMAEEQVYEELEQEAVCMSDEKMIKLASLAILMRSFSSEKMKNILTQFEKPERDVLLNYLKMPDLEDQLDIKATMRCFEEMKNTLPEAIVVSYDKAYKKMCKIVKNSDKNRILNIIDKERPVVKEFVMGCYRKEQKRVPAYIADVISEYVEKNVS